MSQPWLTALSGQSGERLAERSHEPKVTAEWGGPGDDASRRLQARTETRAVRVRRAHKSVVLPDRILRLFLHPIFLVKKSTAVDTLGESCLTVLVDVGSALADVARRATAHTLSRISARSRVARRLYCWPACP
jgi:hypothetical protein